MNSARFITHDVASVYTGDGTIVTGMVVVEHQYPDGTTHYESTGETPWWWKRSKNSSRPGHSWCYWCPQRKEWMFGSDEVDITRSQLKVRKRLRPDQPNP